MAEYFGDLFRIMWRATPAIVDGFFPVRISSFEMLSAVALQTSIKLSSKFIFLQASSAYLEEEIEICSPGMQPLILL